MHPLLNIGLQVARAVGTQLSREFDRIASYRDDRQMNIKQLRSTLESMAEEMIHTKYSGHAVDFISLSTQEAETVWLIDVLNGEANYQRGLPHFAVSLVILQQNKPEHCLIYDPLMDEVFTATRHQQVQCNRFRIRVRSETTPEMALIAGAHTLFDCLSLKPEQCYQTGCNALMIAYSAVRYDAFIGEALSDLEVLIGILLLKTAGGMVTDLKGGEGMMDRKELVGCDLKLLKLLIPKLKKIK